MRWFRGHSEAPRLLSLSPLQAEEDLDGSFQHSHASSPYRDMSPVRWVRRKSSSSDSERNCYNVQTSRVTTERSSNKKDKKKIQQERRKMCEKKNPLLDRVKNTRLTFFRDQEFEGEMDDEEEEEELEDEESRYDSVNELNRRALSRNAFRRSVCESDLKEITEEEKIQTRRKRRSKSHNRLPGKKHNDQPFSFLGFRPSSNNSRNNNNDDDSARTEEQNASKSSGIRWRTNKWRAGQEDCLRNSSNDIQEPSIPQGNHFDSVTPSSCLAAKFRAMQDRYLKNSTSRLIAKIYKKDGQDKEKRRLRSFSYGTLPGLDELRTNPLYEDQEQDDNDSGILDNDSATSSLFDDRCSSGASGLFPNSSINETSSGFPSPPQLPPRRPPSLSNAETDLEKSTKRLSSCEQQLGRIDDKSCSELSKDLCRSAANQRRASSSSLDRSLKCQANFKSLRILEDDSTGNNEYTSERVDRSISKIEASMTKYNPQCQLPVVRNRTYVTETIVVKLRRERTDQCLGIFIAKTAQSNPGYLVAHVVPNGLADTEGTLKIGDEILIVNGKRLRGLSMAEARKILGNGNGPGEVDIVISRYTGVDQPNKRLKESSVDYENVSMENGHGRIMESPSKQHFRKNPTKRQREKKDETSSLLTTSEKSACNTEGVAPATSQNVPNFCTLPRRPRSTMTTFHTVVFEKGPGKKSLGFTIVGGRDSPKRSIGIFIKSVLPTGQAAEDGRLRAGDEILAVNGQVCHDLTHRQAVQLFRNIKTGPVALHLCKRIKSREAQALKAKSCADLLLVDT